jgi:hypothetical protein
MHVHGGDSRRAKANRKRATGLARRMAHGDSAAAFSLMQRGRGLRSAAKGGWHWQLQLATAAWVAKCKLRREERAAGAQLTEAQHAQLQERGERKTQAQIAVMERAQKQAQKELEARLQRQRPVRS